VDGSEFCAEERCSLRTNSASADSVSHDERIGKQVPRAFGGKFRWGERGGALDLHWTGNRVKEMFR
jgi:hypothetical protein